MIDIEVYPTARRQLKAIPPNRLKLKVNEIGLLGGAIKNHHYQRVIQDISENSIFEKGKTLQLQNVSTISLQPFRQTHKNHQENQTFSMLWQAKLKLGKHTHQI